MAGKFRIDENLYTAMHKCTRCGQCAYGTEEAGYRMLCPMQMKGKFFTYSAGGLMQLARSLYEGKITFTESVRDILFLCTTCGACELNCGVIGSQVDLITLLKKEMLNQGISMLETHYQLTENVLKRKAPYAGRLPGRTDWIPKELRENISDQPEVFYFAGCVSSYMETEIPLSFLRVLDKLNVPYSVNDEEWCCGAPLYFAGREDAVAEIARHNAALIEKSGSSTAVLTCPTCSLIFKNYYPRWLKKDLPFDVLHAAEYLNRLREDGRLALERKGEQKIATYHDPCHLGRGQGVYDEPRRIIDGIEGIAFKEMTLTGKNSLCCGGGGLLPTGFPDYADELATARASVIKDMNADLLISSCPACKENLKIAVKRSKIKTRVMDLVELIDELLQ